MPSVAERELDQHSDLIFDILDLRAYASAKREYERLDTLSHAQRAELMNDPLMQEVVAIETELHASDGQRRGDGDSASV